MHAYGYTQTNLSNLTEISKTGNHFYNFKGVNFLCKMNPKNTKIVFVFHGARTDKKIEVIFRGFDYQIDGVDIICISDYLISIYEDYTVNWTLPTKKYKTDPIYHEIISALLQKKYDKVLQVGSQRVSSIGLAKAKELLAAGEIGNLNMVNAVYDRQSSIGAWEYTIPNDATAASTDWDKFIEVTGKMEFDAKKFFWWRAYKEVGTGVAGDLFIHLLSGAHFITNSKGPETIYSTGQFSHWNDGRNMPDVMSGVMQYGKNNDHPAFQMTLQVNFISGTGGQEITRLIGSEGVMDVNGNTITVKHSYMPEALGFGGYDSLFTFSKSMQSEMQKEYDAKWTAAQRKRKTKADVLYKAPAGYDEHLDHFTNFFDAIRTGKPVVEDAAFGFRAAAPALACNESYFSKQIIHWDPTNMKLK